MTTIEFLNNIIRFAETGKFHKDAADLARRLREKLTPEFERGDVVKLNDPDNIDDGERKVEYYVFDIIQDEMKYWVEDIDEQYFSGDELTLVRKAAEK